MITANQYYKMKKVKSIIECARDYTNKKYYMGAIEFIDVITNVLIDNFYHKNIQKTDETRKKIVAFRTSKSKEVVKSGITKLSAKYRNNMINFLEKLI